MLIKYRVHISGVDQSLKDKYSKHVEELGGQYHPNLMTYTKIVICESVKNLKYKQAEKIGAAVVQLRWLDACI